MNVTYNKKDISVMSYENGTVAVKYWLSTPHYYGYNYAVANVEQNGTVVQDSAIHKIYGAHPRIWMFLSEIIIV